MRNVTKQTATSSEKPKEPEQNAEICCDSLSLPCDQDQAEVHPPSDPDPVPIDSVSTPSQIEVPVACENCKSYIQRFENLEDSCRKVKSRKAVLKMEVDHLKKINKDLRKVKKLFAIGYRSGSS